ncbi:hypothetical protein HPB50_007974 [Hyalomma asiaticum]|uniref:Uncharacterized protein n=1 Tax=Hyalomma asiaticum TaxID=266040 RepID=A0ACB7T669_HYAAI|nr:hypothetical protein HPB50_007974 [Hyalomma asiaticum]
MESPQRRPACSTARETRGQRTHAPCPRRSRTATQQWKHRQARALISGPTRSTQDAAWILASPAAGTSKHQQPPPALFSRRSPFSCPRRRPAIRRASTDGRLRCGASFAATEKLLCLTTAVA